MKPEDKELDSGLNPNCHVCPWWLAYTFDHPWRRLLQKPETILAPYVSRGMTVLDFGCGMGFFSIPMARMVGEEGRIISVDLQQKMLDVLMKRAARAKVAPRIQPHRCESTDLKTTAPVDFALAFYVVHEVPDPDRLLRQIRSTLKPGGKLLIAEPNFEINPDEFQQTITRANNAGFMETERPRIRLSRAVVLQTPA